MKVVNVRPSAVPTSPSEIASHLVVAVRCRGTRRAGAASHVIVSRHDVAGVAWFCERCKVSGTWVENKPIQRTMTGITSLGVSLAAFIHRHRGCSRSS